MFRTLAKSQHALHGCTTVKYKRTKPDRRSIRELLRQQQRNEAPNPLHATAFTHSREERRGAGGKRQRERKREQERERERERGEAHVNSLGKEVSDLGQLMARMAQLMDSFMSRSHAPSLCPAHCSPHHAYLPHPSPPHPPPPPAAAPAGLWTDTPTSLPCSPQPHLRRPQELHLSPAPLLLQPRPPADPAPTHLQHSLMPCPAHGGMYSDDTLWEHSRSATL
ncbi:hypothetical protein WMY93_028862 [Mugilogobius chulae]|uniref:Uncharacterized protein n=1 Tax=Mugilogobius chulae TaxID=88201 RepID=A0AAW0MWA0_9GOBI